MQSSSTKSFYYSPLGGSNPHMVLFLLFWMKILQGIYFFVTSLLPSFLSTSPLITNDKGNGNNDSPTERQTILNSSLSFFFFLELSSLSCCLSFSLDSLKNQFIICVKQSKHASNSHTSIHQRYVLLNSLSLSFLRQNGYSPKVSLLLWWYGSFPKHDLYILPSLQLAPCLSLLNFTFKFWKTGLPSFEYSNSSSGS